MAVNSESDFIHYIETVHRKLSRKCRNDWGPWYITDHIFLGRLDNARNATLLYHLDINSLLNCAACHETIPTDSDSYEEYHSFEAKDVEDYPIEQHFEEALLYLNRCKYKGNKVLIYCKQGINRSVTICILYMVTHCYFSLVQAVSRVFQIKHNILTNTGFLRSLYRYCKTYGYPIH